MKNLLQFSILILISITTLFSSIESQAQSQDNKLTVKGKTLGDHVVDILVFEYDSTSNTWTQTAKKFSKSTYRLRVNPEKNYQVWFTNTEGAIKILFINKGESGVWKTEVDIDFDQINQSNGYLCQNDSGTSYKFTTVSKEFALFEAMASSKK